MVDVSNFCGTEIVDILSETVDSKVVLNSKTPDISGVSIQIIQILLRH